MNPRRTSIAGLMGIVGVVALGMAAMRSATVLWTAAASTITLALLLTAVVGAIWLRGPDRAYWSGFATFGWAYLLLVNWEWIGGQFGHDLTSGFLDIAEWAVPKKIVPVSAPPPAGASPVMAPPPAGAFQAMANRSITVGNFVQIGRLLIALVFALIGGSIARAFAARAEASRGDHPRTETTHG
jgi:hypothetical protein